jgi:AraC family transcriptional regulator
MENLSTGHARRASLRLTSPPVVRSGDANRLGRCAALAAISSSFAADLSASESVRSESLDALRGAVVALIHAVNGVLNEELESAIGSVRRSAELLKVSACVPAFRAAPRIASRVARGGLAPWQARMVKTYIVTHLDGNLGTNDLAQLVQLSSFHFCRVFRVSFGYSPHTYVTRRRVERAQGLILTTNLTLGQIALDCGFADQAHFTKTFRRSCGESPGEWRRTRMVGTNEPTPRTNLHSRNLPNTSRMI